MTAERPTVFIGSSREGLHVARAVQAELEHDADPTIWNQGVFEPGEGTLESLVQTARHFDFALMVVHGDDRVETRGEQSLAPRDNVLFELGFFIGAIGRDRTFFLLDRSRPPKLPTDIAGVTALTYSERTDGNLRAAVGPACHAVRRQIVKLGRRKKDLTIVDLVCEASRLRQRDPSAAAELCKRAIEMDPTYDPAYLNLFEVLRQLGRYDAALEVINSLLVTQPHHSAALRKRGHLSWSMRRFEEALHDFDKSIEVNPQNPSAFYFRGRALEDLGRLEESIQSYEGAVAADPLGKFGRRSAERVSIIRAAIRHSR